MSEEAKPAEATNALAAPEAAETAPVAEAPVSGETKPEVQSEAKPKPEERKFSQAEVEAMIGKRLAREERKWQRELQRQQPVQHQEAQPKPEVAAKPSPDKYASTEDYIEAVSEWKASQLFEAKFGEREKTARETKAREMAQVAAAEYSRREEAARIVHDDFDDVVYNPQLAITQAMAHTLQHSESGPELAYHLGKNPQEAARIATLPPFLQAKELGKLEAKLPVVSSPANKTTSAPEPIKPLSSSKSSAPALSTDDPKAAEKMSTTEWIKQREQEKRKRLEAQGYR